MHCTVDLYIAVRSSGTRYPDDSCTVAHMLIAVNAKTLVHEGFRRHIDDYIQRQPRQSSCSSQFSSCRTSTRTSYKLAKMGKVHGSLARAGKVKSQTPKVWANPPRSGDAYSAATTIVKAVLMYIVRSNHKRRRSCLRVEQRREWYTHADSSMLQ